MNEPADRQANSLKLAKAKKENLNKKLLVLYVELNFKQKYNNNKRI